MAKQNINVGSSPNDRSGDSLRAAFQKINANFTELYTALGLDVAPLNLGAFEFSGSTLSTTDSSAITIDQATTVTSNLTVGGDLLPSVANGGDLGSAAKPWKSLYVSNSTIYLGGAALKIDNEGELTLNDNRIVQQNGQYIDLNLHVRDVNVSDPQPGDTLQWGPGYWINVPNGITNNIESETDIAVKINLTDSTQRIWTFTEGGDLRFPDGTTQTTAYTGSESSSGSDLEFEAYYVYQSNMDAEATKFKGNRDNKPLNALRELRLSSRALDAADTEISVRSQLDMLVEQPRVSELTMTLTTDTTKTFDYEVTHISRNVYQTDYRGYTGRFVRSYSNDSGIIRVVIGRGNTSTILFDPRANNEDWMVDTGSCSTIMSFMIADHSAYIRKDREKITKFFEAVIDNIAFDGATEITDAAVMRTRFYANIDTLVSAIGGNLYYDFRAYNSTRTFTNVPISSATSTVAAGITIRAQNTGKYQAWVGIDTPGEGFQVGQTIVIPGSSLDQYSEDLGQQQNGVHDATVTVTEVDGVGGITNFTVSGTGIGIWGSDNISDGEDDQFDTSMRYQTNLLQTLYRSDGSSWTTDAYLNYNGGLVTDDDRAVDAFGAGSKYVISFHKGIVSLFATGVSNSVTWFSITGNSGRDGNGTVDEGEVRIGTVYRLFVRCLSGPEYFAVNNDKFRTTLRSTDRLGLIEIVNPNNDQNTVENDIYLQSLHAGDFFIKGNDRLTLTANRDVTLQAGNGISSARAGYDVYISGGDGMADDRLNSNPTGPGGDVFIESGQGGTIQHTITAMTNASPAVITLTDRVRIGAYSPVSFLLDGDLGNSITSTTIYSGFQISETEIEIYDQNGVAALDTSSMPAFTSGAVIIGDKAGNINISSLHPAAIFHGELELNHFVWPNTHQSAVVGQILQISSDTSAETGHKKLVFNNDLNLIGDIRSETEINIDINLSDSTLRRWTFGEDGDLRLPGALTTNGYIKALGPTDGLGNGDNLTVQAGETTTGDGGDLTVHAGDTVTGVGGDLTVRSGVAVTGNAGVLNVRASDTVTGDGGMLNIRAGDAVTGDAGDIDIRAGDTITGDGGSITITAGSTVNSGPGGSVTITSGSNTSGAAGDISLVAATSVAGADGVINLTTAIGSWTFDEAGNLTFPIGLTIENFSGMVPRIRAVDGTAAVLGGASATTGEGIIIQAGNGGADDGVDPMTGGGGGGIIIAGGTGTGDFTGGDIQIFGGFDANGNFAEVTIGNGAGQFHFYGNGTLEFPDSTVQSTAFTTSPTLNVLKIDDGVHEKFQTKADATGTVTHDCSAGHIFYHTSPDADWTVNLTNLNLASGYATTVSIVIVQGGTGYYPTVLQIGGAGQTINWQGNATPTPSTNRTDVVTFSIINNAGTYTVLGQLTGF